MSGSLQIGQTGERLKVLIIAPLRFPLREPFSGGLEAQTWALAHGLSERGHTVEVAGPDGSDDTMVTHRIGALPDAGSERADISDQPAVRDAERRLYDGLMTDLAQGLFGSFDLVHNNSLHPSPVERAATLPVPMVTGLHTPPLPWAPRLSGRPIGRFVAVSRATALSWQPYLHAEVVRNGVDTAAWTAGPGGPGAVWFGRIVPEKAPHLAVDLARAAGLRLTLAGPIIDRAYFRSELQPRLGAGVEYAGHLTRAELTGLVGSSAVTLVTPVWDEPFGMVAVESMACGTPVVAFARGGLIEIVEPHTGRLIPGPDSGRPLYCAELVGAVDRIGAALALPRDQVRRRAVSSWSLDAMAAGYERVFVDAVRATRD